MRWHTQGSGIEIPWAITLVPWKTRGNPMGDPSVSTVHCGIMGDPWVIDLRETHGLLMGQHYELRNRWKHYDPLRDPQQSLRRPMGRDGRPGPGHGPWETRGRPMGHERPIGDPWATHG